MFSILRRKKSKVSLDQHFQGFQNQFSANQKLAIMASLFIIANADGEFHNKEARFLKEVALALGYNYIPKNLDEFMKIGPEKVFQKLNSLEDSQKDWYIITAFAMLHVDGQALDIEFQYLETYFAKMEITRERFEQVVKKSQLLINDIL